ncbi:MAG: type I-C CRISPR-associated protein Cas8c/Csd1 [Oscillospiraceae bacterium]|nr:type I-C CRISPR-associated protein Cas8c/Csd1 [Oscillospiraceae bacterium]
MLIKALCDYADAQGDISDELEEYKLHYYVQLSREGELIDIVEAGEYIPIETKTGKMRQKYIPKKVIYPKRLSTTVIKPYYLEHRPAYIFGLNYLNGKFTPYDDKNNAYKSHKAFVEHELEFLEDLDSEICIAYKKFIQNWNPETECENPILNKIGKDFSNSNFGFSFGIGDACLEEDEQYRQKYLRTIKKEVDVSELTYGICSILGERLPLARLHDKIKFPGGHTSGCPFVCMNDNAFESYGKTQSFNSGVSEEAMKKYTSMFNKLLADKDHHAKIGDMVIIYFAVKNDDSAECRLFGDYISDSGKDKIDGETEQAVNTRIKEAAQGLAPSESTVANMEADPNSTFYIAGFTPNSSRICQKFIYRNSFGSIMKNMIKHRQDMMIGENSSRKIYFSTIGRELISPKSTNEKPPPPLMANIMLAAFNGTRYPDGLLATVVNRIKTDSDEDKKHYIKINSVRAGLLKACINRKYNREVIKMSWDKENRNPGYICGGMFAIYEKIQKDSVEGELNRTIKDAYFASACSRPASVFAKLTTLSMNHMRKLDDGVCIFYNKLIQETLDNIDGNIPLTLTNEDQAQFCLGYFLMNSRLYSSNKSDRKD